MNLTDFVVTLILVGVFLSGTFIFAGEHWTNFNTSQTISGDLAYVNSSSQNMVEQAEEIYGTTQELEPYSKTDEGTLAKGLWATVSIIASSLGNIGNMVSSIGEVFQIPSVLLSGIGMALTIIVVMAIYRSLRGGVRDI